MEPFQAIILGILQGLTEFLPVSSSGHLVLAQSFLPGFSQPGVLFDAVLHGGTMLAVLWYFRKMILKLDKRMLMLLALGTVPAGLVGITFKDFLEGLFSNTRLVGIALLITGGMNWFVDSAQRTGHSKQGLKAKDALFVGIFQAVAIIPGISRSGSTIFAGAIGGIKKEEAAVFSFLLSIPAVAGSVGLEVISHADKGGVDFTSYFLGAIAAFIVGYFSIGILMRFLVEKKFKVFAIYCWIVGLTTLIFTL